MQLDRRLYPRLRDFDYLHLTLLREAIAFYANQCHGVVVDYGCGTKPYRPLFQRATRYVGVDFDAKGPDDLALLPDGGMPLPNQSADVVFSAQVLEHVRDTAFYLAECRRVLRTGGHFLLTTHGMWPYHPDPTGRSDDYFRWTGAGLRKIVEDAGFRVAEIRGDCLGWICLAQQSLVIWDPARRHNYGRLHWLVTRGRNTCVNTLALLARKLFPKWSQAGDILPVCYVVWAVKT